MVLRLTPSTRARQTTGVDGAPPATPAAPALPEAPLPPRTTPLPTAPGAGRTPMQVLCDLLQDGPKGVTDTDRAAEARTDEVLSRVVARRGLTDPEVKAEVGAYVKEIGDKIDAKGKLSVHEHTAVTFLLKCGLFDGPDGPDGPGEDLAPVRRTPTADGGFDAQMRASLTRSLRASWKALTGKDRPDDQLLTRLPKMALRKASRKERVYHAAAFIPLTKDREVRLKASSLFRDYVPENQDALLATGALLSSIFTDAGRWAVGSLIMQYTMYSITENVLHDHLAHPKGRIGEWFQKGPSEDAGWLERAVHGVLGKVMKHQVDVTSGAHVGLHHRMTFRKSFTQMFDDRATKEAVDKWMDENFDPAMADKLRDEKYATSLNLGGMSKIFSTIVPQTAVYIALGALLGAPAWLLAPTVLMAALYPVAMGKGHPIYHVSQSEAKETASTFMKELRKTRYISYSARNHWMHHHYPDANFNLSYPGADALMGMLIQPNLQDLYRMAEDDVLHY